jgi:hypothetical protein
MKNIIEVVPSPRVESFDVTTGSLIRECAELAIQRPDSRLIAMIHIGMLIDQLATYRSDYGAEYCMSSKLECDEIKSRRVALKNFTKQIQIYNDAKAKLIIKLGALNLKVSSGQIYVWESVTVGEIIQKPKYSVAIMIPLSGANGIKQMYKVIETLANKSVNARVLWNKTGKEFVTNKYNAVIETNTKEELDGLVKLLSENFVPFTNSTLEQRVIPENIDLPVKEWIYLQSKQIKEVIERVINGTASADDIETYRKLIK